MYVSVQPHLPGCSPHVLVGHVSIAVSSDGMTTVGWRVEDPMTGELLALGCLPPNALQDAERVSPDVLRELLRLLPTLVDAPPFD